MILNLQKKKFPQLNSNTPVHEDIVAQIFSPFLQEPANKQCADCNARGPTWSSTNLGILICLKCSGIHRSLGTHLSKVKSTSLDRWLPAQIEFVFSVGNAKAREIYEARLPDGFVRPTETYTLELFIRAKYERKQYIKLDYVPASFPRSVEQPSSSTFNQVQNKEQKKEPNKDLISIDFNEAKSNSQPQIKQVSYEKPLFDLFDTNAPNSSNSMPNIHQSHGQIPESKHQAAKESILSLYQTPQPPVYTNLQYPGVPQYPPQYAYQNAQFGAFQQYGVPMMNYPPSAPIQQMQPMYAPTPNQTIGNYPPFRLS